MSLLDAPGVDTLLARVLWERRALGLEALQGALQEARAQRATLARRLVATGQAPAPELERVLSEALGVAPAPLRQLGPYLLRERLGQGGMGVVWLAEHSSTRAQVAIKTLPATSDPEFRARFLREGEAQARVDEHPHVVRVHSAGSEGGTLYLVLDYAPGGDLAARIAAAGPLPPRRAAEVARDLARGLAHVHAAGVLHRDLKPQNVLFGEDERPRLVDFGLARLEGRTALTESGVVLGTPAYMAPEQARGEREAFGPATDVYGLGALLHFVLAGRPPFVAGTLLATLDQVLTREPEPTGADPGLDAICRRCLAKDPAERYASAGDLAADLESWLAGESLAARRGSPLGLALVGTALLGGLAALGLGLATAAQDPLPATPVGPDWARRGIEACQRGEWRSALRDLDQALEEGALAEGALEEGSPDLLEVRAWRGKALRELDRPAEALLELTAAYEGGRVQEERSWLSEAWAAQGEEALSAGALARAERAFASSRRISPDSRRARLGLGWVWVRLGRCPSARDLASELIAEDERSSEAHLLRACALRRIPEQIHDAASDHDRAVERAPGAARPLVERAIYSVVYFERSRSQQGLLDAENALILSPNDPEVLALHGYKAVRLGELKRAKGFLDRARTQSGAFPGALLRWARGLWHVRSKAPSERESWILAKQSQLAAHRLDPWDPHVNLELGWLFRRLGEDRAAERFLDRGLRLQPFAMGARRDRSFLRSRRGDRLGELEDLEFLAREGLATADHLHVSRNYRKLGYPERALRAILRIRRGRRAPDALMLQAESLFDLGRFDEARELLDSLHARDREKLASRLESAARKLPRVEALVTEIEALQDPRSEIPRLHEIVRAAPERVEWWTLLARLQLEAPGARRDAIYSATRGLELDPERLELLELRARALAHTGDARAARQDLLAFLARAPAEHPSRRALAHLYATLLVK